MKKITLLILLLVCAFSYGQSSVKANGTHDPVHYSLKQQGAPVGKTNMPESKSGVTLKATSKRNNKQVVYGPQNSSRSNSTSATFDGNNNPQPRNYNVQSEMNVQAPVAYYKSEAAPVGEVVEGMKTTTYNPEFIIPFTGTYGFPGNNAIAALIYDNGSHFNIAGPPPVSMLQDLTLGMATYGFGSASINGQSMSDDVTLTDDYEIDSIDVYAYQTGSVPPSITALFLQVWDGDPSGGGASVIWGDLTTNILSSAVTSTAYRQLESAPGNTQREIQRVTGVTAGLSLTAGTYWIEYSFAGSGASGPWAPPIVITGNATTGNALQNIGGVWAPAIDVAPQGLPFQIYGDPIGGGGGACASPILEVNQPETNTCMANLSQTGLAQSYIAVESESAGAGVMFSSASSGLDVNLSLWDALPNAGGTMLASGTSQTAGDVWTDVFWDNVANVTPGNTYYIVIEGDFALPCVEGSLNNPYAGGNLFANTGYQPFPGFDYTFRTYSCDSGGGGGASCSQADASNGFENGYGNTNNTVEIADEIIVDADTDFEVNQLTINMINNGGFNSVNVGIYENAGGMPGAIIGSIMTIVPTSSTVIGTAFGRDVLSIVLDITPSVMLTGASGSETVYWIGVETPSPINPASDAYWETTSIANPGTDFRVHYDVANGGWISTLPGDAMFNTVYTVSGTCFPMGGGGNDCTSTAFDSTAVPFDIDGAGNSTVDCVNAPNLIPITVADLGTIGSGAILENITIDITHTFTADLDLYLISPSGTEFLLANDLGGGTDNGYNGTMFEDGGADITVATAPFGVGPYAPMGGTFAAAFAGEDITGDWNLKVCDDAGGDTGQVLQFSMSICVPPVLSYDDCENAIALSCGDSVTGETLTATDSGGNAAPDVFYKFTGNGSPQLVTISLCGGGTDYDSLLRVFDDCDLLNQLALNDDFCGLQSEVSFQSDGTSTYYIMVEGFGSGSGNFSLDVSCIDPLPNDDCGGAIAVSCGDSVTGTTVGSTIDTAPTCGTPITSGGVWYSLEDNSGLPGSITVSLCAGTDYDSKLSIYSGTCAAPVCVDGNDDSCGLQSEVTFASNGNTTFLILVHGFGGGTGNFTLDVTCAPTPPPNDRIVNSIDVDEIGFPYTDPAVAMPAATVENGSPQGCDLTGANGVWYNFVPVSDGTAFANIITPGGASSVTFYTAPDETSIETDLVLVPQQENQCAPGTTALINTVGGQAYYVFVLNNGAITDIVIDGTGLGVSDNEIAGFSYYPNPTTGILNLKSVENIEKVSLYNVLGQLVMDSRINATTSNVDMSALSTGTYLMKVSVNGETGTYRVLKQ